MVAGDCASEGPVDEEVTETVSIDGANRYVKLRSSLGKVRSVVTVLVSLLLLWVYPRVVMGVFHADWERDEVEDIPSSVSPVSAVVGVPRDDMDTAFESI